MNNKTRKEILLVVGGCAAGMSAASKAKRTNPALKIIALEKSPHVSYSACGIPYYVADIVREARELVTITPEEFREKRGIEVFTCHEVVEIQPVKRLVTAINLTTGKEIQYAYDKLVLSVGGCPIRPAIPGVDLKNVFTLQTLQDGICLRQYVDTCKPKNAVIIGGGYIAMEMAEAFRHRFLEVTIIEKEAHILPDYEPEIVAVIEDELKRHRVKVITGSKVIGIEGDGGNVAQTVILPNETRLSTDLVLLATGLRPNTRLAESLGLRVGSTGAIIVDWKMQTSLPNIYAAGDCVEVKNLVTGKPDYIPLGPTANKQGRIAGENIAGGYATFKGVVGTSVFKTFHLEVAKTGLSTRQAARHGFEADKVTITANNKAGYYPGVKPVTVTVIFDRRQGRFLGAQMVGEEGVSKRIDIFATALTNKMTLTEMANLDLSYAPPFAPVWDPVLVVIQVAKGKIK
ncbi:MAG: NADH oxidase [Calditrichaeota bacterium]|nr:MAG: NADH oxidase [Calditrichota bacterium]